MRHCVTQFKNGYCTYLESNGWHQWDYSAQWSGLSVEDALHRQAIWLETWGSTSTTSSGVNSTKTAPRPRRGHSLVLFHSHNSFPYFGDSYIIMFGGRDNDGTAEHVPKTYDLVSVNGSLEFTTYDAKPVHPCADVNGTYFSAADRAACSNSSTNKASTIDVGVFYNDVWAYKLCRNQPPYRYFNGPCEDTGWVVWDEGALEGGCEYKLDVLVCTTPSERYNHGAVVFDDGAMLIYGGFSKRCADYCDDFWMFDVNLRVWRQMYNAGTLSRLKVEVLPDGTTIPYEAADVSVDNGGFSGPGKRWRHSMVCGEAYNDTDGRLKQQMAVFGGHRLWQGFSAENSEDNGWTNYSARPHGGYMNDLWIYTRVLDNSTSKGVDLLTYEGSWRELEPKQQCESSPGITWESRGDIVCTETWPEVRAGHVSALDSQRNLLWVFGGYSTYFPYLSTDGQGAGPGISTSSGGFVPYPAYSYYRNDLWYYNFTDGYWTQVGAATSDAVPTGRMDCVMLLLGEALFLHGGYGDNEVFDDTWYFNISTLAWLQKTEFVTPIFPQSCTDDLDYVNDPTNNCTHLQWPEHLERDPFYPFNITDYAYQPYYWPELDVNGTKSMQFFDVLPFGSDAAGNLTLTTPLNGTALYPYSASGPLQYVRPFLHPLNATYSLTLLEACTNVFSDPTRGTTLDGVNGRASSPILIAQPRRQRAGWDGCRDRYDGRTDLPQELQYVRPKARFGHRAVYNADYKEIVVYGGMAFVSEHAPSVQDSYPIRVSDEMWYYALNQCQNNCSSHGDCRYGYCFCDSGFYGVDCSNSSCPGTFCQYDARMRQVCVHACQAGYSHTDADLYVPDIAKIPCSADNLGESNGICDGFGTSYCAPPFVGEDCSIKDCMGNCSFNGWCSEEYPVSRCMCMPGFFGEVCELKHCLNNCTYPNGLCDPLTGNCTCNMMYSPYNNTREYFPWGGEDCSYLFAYAGSDRACVQPLFFVVVLVILSIGYLLE